MARMPRNTALAFLHGVIHHQLFKHLAASLDQIEMAVGQRVETARINGAHKVQNGKSRRVRRTKLILCRRGQKSKASAHRSRRQSKVKTRNPETRRKRRIRPEGTEESFLKGFSGKSIILVGAKTSSHQYHH